METTIAENIRNLKALSIAQLRTQYRELFGEEHATRHRDTLARRIAWRLQVLAEGGLSERAAARAEQLASDADIRILIPRSVRKESRQRGSASARDSRLPPPGSLLKRQYRGRSIEVLALENGWVFG